MTGPETLRYAAIMLAAGVGIPILAALNASLGQRIASPATAAFCLFLVALTATGAVLVVTGSGTFQALAAQPRHLFLAGLLVAFYILSITWIAPRFGIGNAVFFVLLGQLVAAAAIDHFGLFGARISPLSPMRAGGIALMALGVFCTQKA
jgi:bacterial/archaeal transporter family-2 protein